MEELLKSFEGVIVSDFYTGYDSLPCPQQKCLVHLIRDLNEGLLKNQLDLEYKSLVSEFGKLLRKIIVTVDQYGLKRKNLQKHKIDIEYFYCMMSKNDYTSEMALKCQKRLEKNRDKLFTFIDYDGIPWNNNNAEHAIRPFADYRRDVDNIFTENTITEYLLLLSIQQTCIYRGINFLDFLLSREKSIDMYTQKRRR